MTTKRIRAPRAMAGSTLIESLIAMVILGVGILAHIGLQANAITNAAESKYRADAALLADQIIGMMRADVANVSQYSHNANAGQVAEGCAPSASPSINDNVKAWIRDVADTLPGAGAEKQQIMVDPSGNGRVVVRVCWQGPTDPAPHNVVVGAVVE